MRTLPSRKTERRLSRSQRWVRALALLILALALYNFGRAAMAWLTAVRLPDLSLTVPPAYLAGAGIAWGAAFVACAVGLFRFRPWSRRATLTAATLYEAHAWAVHLLFDASDYARQTWPRDLLLSGLLLAFVWGLLYRPGVRRLFGLPPARRAPREARVA